MLHIKVAVSVIATSPILPAIPTAEVVTPPPTGPTNPTAVRVNSSPTERATHPPMAPIPLTATFTDPLSRMDRLPIRTNPPMSPPADVRASPTRNAHATSHTQNAHATSHTQNPRVETLPATDEGTKMAKAREREELMEAHHSGPLLIPEFEETIDDIIQAVERSVHRSEAESFLLT
jgi:hypothetical protein